MDYLIEESPLTVLPTLAVAIGLHESMIIQQVQYWISINKKEGRNYIDGKYWTYNTFEAWQKQFPFWTTRTIQNLVAKLEKKGYLISANYNKSKFDRTKWYTLDYEKLNEAITLRTGFVNGAESDSLPIPETNLTETNNKNLKGRFPKKTTEGFISSFVEDYGEDRVTAMIDAVNSYIDDWYVDETCRNHPQESNYKRAVFAKKLLDCADKTGIDDDTVVNGLYKALVNHPDDVDPQIYYATSDKPLGNGLLATKEIDYCQIAGTDYDINT